MAETFKFELVSPERLLFSADVKSVQVPGDEGDFVVLADHAPVMTIIRPGVVVVETENDEKKFFIKGGFADATPDGLTILAEFSLDQSELVKDRLDAEIKKAQKELDEAEHDFSLRHANLLVDYLEDLR